MDESFWSNLQGPLQQMAQFAPRIAAALFVIVISVIIGRILGRNLVRLLARGNFTRTHNLFFRNLTLWFFILLGTVVSLSILGLETALAGFLAGSGVAAVILGFAFRDIGENLLAGLFLAFSRPFNVGDFILSENLEGEIREIELRYTHIRTADGRDIYIPNSQMFNKPLTNYTRDGLRRPTFIVGIDYADSTETARRLIEEAVRGVPDVLADPEPIVVVANLAPEYVELEVSFWINTFQFENSGASSSVIAQEEALRRIRSRVMEASRTTLMDNGITVSANVTSNVALDVPRQVGIRVAHEVEK